MNAHFYIYLLFDPQTLIPFYAGKGSRNRCYCHEVNAKRYTVREWNHPVLNKIRKLQQQDLRPIIVKWYEDLLESQAFFHEKILISLIGRKDLGKGPLLNLSDGGEGSSGRIVTKSCRDKHSMYMQRYFSLDTEEGRQHRKRQSDIVLVRLQTPEGQAIKLENMRKQKQYWSKAENREAQSEALTTYFYSPLGEIARVESGKRQSEYYKTPEGQATIIQIKESLRNGNYGKPHTQATKDAIGKGNTGKVRSPELRQQIAMGVRAHHEDNPVPADRCEVLRAAANKRWEEERTRREAEGRTCENCANWKCKGPQGGKSCFDVGCIANSSCKHFTLEATVLSEEEFKQQQAKKATAANLAKYRAQRGDKCCARCALWKQRGSHGGASCFDLGKQAEDGCKYFEGSKIAV